jgi:hypothetical protein
MGVKRASGVSSHNKRDNYTLIVLTVNNLIPVDVDNE